MMPVSAERILRDIEAIAGFSQTPVRVGHSRPTFTPAWRAARDYVIAQAKAAGCRSRIDAAGNVHIRPADVPWNQRVWLSGSHIDSVPTGGKFDGVAGIVAPLEVLRCNPAAPLELIVFAEEEGTTFGIGMIGSRLWTGSITAESLVKFRNQRGESFIEAGRGDGVDAARLGGDLLRPDAYLGLIEIHVEQGPTMWAQNQRLAVVSAIAGRRQYRAQITGTANHAGSTPMNYRSDALCAAAAVILGLQKMAVELGNNTVATVGMIECEPNAINVIPGLVLFSIDVRSPRIELLEKADSRIRELLKSNGLQFELTQTEDQPPIPMDESLCQRLVRAAGGNVPMTTSGALHDAAIIAPHIPTAMIFLASRDGISHNPAEFSRVEDIAAAAAVLETLVSEP